MSQGGDVSDALLLAESLATRLCHDLSGHLSALTAAVEVMRDEPGASDEAMALANEAAIMLVRRLRLMRAAWGAGGNPLDVSELRELTDGMFGRRLRIDTSALPGNGRFAAPAARLLLNVVLMATESLPVGGVVEVVGNPNEDLLIMIDGPRAAWPSGLASMLADPALALTWLRGVDGLGAARGLQAPLTVLIANASGLRMSLLMGPEGEIAPPLRMALGRLH